MNIYKITRILPTGEKYYAGRGSYSFTKNEAKAKFFMSLLLVKDYLKTYKGKPHSTKLLAQLGIEQFEVKQTDSFPITELETNKKDLTKNV